MGIHLKVFKGIKTAIILLRIDITRSSYVTLVIVEDYVSLFVQIQIRIRFIFVWKKETVTDLDTSQHTCEYILEEKICVNAKLMTFA